MGDHLLRQNLERFSSLLQSGTIDAVVAQKSQLMVLEKHYADNASMPEAEQDLALSFISKLREDGILSPETAQQAQLKLLEMVLLPPITSTAPQAGAASGGLQCKNYFSSPPLQKMIDCPKKRQILHRPYYLQA